MISGQKARHGMAQAIALWLLVFASGWFVMLTELIGARVLAPYFGNTIYVWGSVIAIFMLALAVGYAAGGSLTKRFDSTLVPSLLAALAGLYVAANPMYQDTLCSWLYNTGMHVKWGALLAAVVLYGPPMALLGGLSPYCIQIATKTHIEAGSRAGTLYAISTMGSFLGCLVTAFVLIPKLPLGQITISAGVMLALVSIVVALALADRMAVAVVAAACLVVGFSVMAYQQPRQAWEAELKPWQYPLTPDALSSVPVSKLGPVLRKAQAEASKEAGKYMSAPPKELLEMETPYHHLVVRQNGPIRELIFGKTGFHDGQSVVDLRQLSWHVSEYTHLAFAGLFYKPKPERALFIGLGGAIIPRSLELVSPGVKIDAVDIDPTIIPIARKYFYWRPSNNVRAFGQDGRSFVNWVIMNKQPKYDWVVIDAFNDDYVPFHLTTIEYMSLIQRILTPDGVLIINMKIDDNLYACEARTVQEVFGNTNAYAGHRSGNIILVAQNGRSKPMSFDEAVAGAKKLRLPKGCSIDPKVIYSTLLDKPNWSSEGPVLTDTWAPVENLIKK